MRIAIPLQLDGSAVIYPGTRDDWSQSHVIAGQLVGEYAGALVDGSGTPLFDWVEYIEPAPVIDYGTRITPLAFMDRFAPTEEGAIRTLAKTDVEVESLVARIQIAAYIDLSDPRTRAGIDALEAGGLLAAGRAAQILDTPVTPIELPLAPPAH